MHGYVVGNAKPLWNSGSRCSRNVVLTLKYGRLSQVVFLPILGSVEYEQLKELNLLNNSKTKNSKSCMRFGLYSSY